jgi:hypothetical protein
MVHRAGLDEGRRYASKSSTDVAVGRQALVSGTLVVAYLFALGRWGSYLGIGPAYITDALVLAAILNLGIRKYRLGRRKRTIASFIPILLIVYIGLRALTSVQYVGSSAWLRDVAPYGYAVLTLVAASSVAGARLVERNRTFDALCWALWIHLAWLSASLIFDLQDRMPAVPGSGGAATLFGPRADIDVAILGITAATAVYRMNLGKMRLGFGWAVCAACLFCAMQFQTRAGLLSVLACAAVIMGYNYYRSAESSRRRLSILLVLILVISATAFALPQTDPGSRLLDTVGVIDGTGSEGVARGQGTQAARLKTWNRVVNWSSNDAVGATFGMGFGVDILASSGALRWLEGSRYENVRSPHNWFVGSYARLGILGLLLLAALLVVSLRRVIRMRVTWHEDHLLFMSLLTVVAMLPVASLGVVLEAPFGAVPFYWSIGVLLAVTPEAGRALGPSTSGVATGL